MCRPNCRVKLDLCKFYNDIRRFCWVFVDSTKVLQVHHLKEHITELFGIEEPFHLLLNDNEYLPPNEDIRVLNENETILVYPCTGLENKLEFSVSTVEESPQSQNTLEKRVRPNHSVKHKESQANIPPLEPNLLLDVKNLLDKVKSRTESEVSEQSTALYVGNDEIDSQDESKVTDTSGLQMSDGFVMAENSTLQPKRKRVRNRKNKNQKVDHMNTPKHETKTKKPKIIDTCILSSGKHIRFDHFENEEFVETKSVQEKSMNGSLTNEAVSPTHHLANLLSLGKHPSPLTFTGTKVKSEVKIEHKSDEETQLVAPTLCVNGSVTISNTQQDRKELLNQDLEACPIMTTQPQLKDVLAFKITKIGLDYTPQVSDFIVAEVISCSPENSVYTFRILKGASELQEPNGKFAIIDDEEEQVIKETITLNYNELIEPRLVSTHD